ncbi:hypothetical protein HYV31_03620 [candidate division WWE3 bacterium]|nr:hypothetical protein [candidate division WWE3 bacterium]
MYNSIFYLSLAALFFSIVSGTYFAVSWFTTGRKHSFLLYFSYGLGTQLLFKIPNMLANGNMKIVQQDFYVFFCITLLAWFLAFFSLIKGIRLLSPPRQPRLTTNWMFFVWLGLAITYFMISFFVSDVYAPIWFSHVLFYIPAQCLLLYEVRQLYLQTSNTDFTTRRGVWWIANGVVFLIATSCFYIYRQVYPYPPQLWYMSVITSPGIAGLQVVESFLLMVGFYKLTQSYLKTHTFK